MRIGTKYPIFNKVKNIFGRKPKQFLDPAMKERWVTNQVEPLKDTFVSTKEMFAYAKERCMADLSGETPKEHSLILDLKRNKVLAEYIGDQHSCTMENIASLPVDSVNTAVFHGHQDSLPISCADVNFLMNNDVNQVVAINSNGEFSLIEKTFNNKTKKEIKSAYRKFRDEILANSENHYDMHTMGSLSYKEEKHRLLKEHSDKMGLRYITNYKIFKH